MSERVPNLNEGTRPLEDAVTLFVGNKIYEGWEDAKVTRELNSAAGDFQLQVVDKWRIDEEPWRIATGDKVHVHLGKQSVVTGYVDKVQPSISKTAKTITVSGRSKTADIVDCSAEGSNQFANLNIKEIADKQCAPFGIKVSLIGSAGDAFPTITLQQGETVFALLDRLARERKLLMYPSYDGNLVLSSVGTLRTASDIIQGVNMLGGNAVHDNSNRHSKYTIKGQNLGYIGDAPQSVMPSGEATDAGITRFRPLILNSENTVSGQTSGDRAAYERDLRAAKALTADVQVQGWTQQDGSLWEINRLVYIDSGFLGLRRRMLIQKVEFNKSNGGTTTGLSLIRADAYGFKKTIEKEKPLGWVKFTK